jgi:hypothetical protein
MKENFHIKYKLKIIKDLIKQLNYSINNEIWDIEYLNVKINKFDGLIQQVPMIQLKQSKNNQEFKIVQCCTLDETIPYLNHLVNYHNIKRR